MAFSMEGRFPIINKRLRDYVRALPSNLKVDVEFRSKPKKKHKYLQKKAYEGLLPDYILNHVKTGWRFPTDEILIGRMDQPAPDNGVLKDYIICLLLLPIYNIIFHILEAVEINHI